VTRLVASLLGPPSFDTKTQPVSVPGPVRDIPRASAAADDNPTPAAAKSEGDPLLAPLSALSPALVVPMHTLGSANSGNSDTQGTSVNPTWDKSKISVTQASATPDLAATTRKNVEAAAGAKAQPHKDDSPASTNSQASDQTKASAPAKAIEAAPSLVAAGSQPSSAGMTADNKNSGAGSPPRGNDQLANQFDRAHVQTPAETQAVYPTSLINSAKLVERIGESELRLGIRAGEFGSVDIRTSMVRNQFTAQISVERGELGRVMAAELPSLQNRLTEQRVAVANITVQNHAGSHSTASEQQKPRDGQAAYATNPVNRRDEGPVPVLVAMEGSAPSSRLDIHM